MFMPVPSSVNQVYVSQGQGILIFPLSLVFQRVKGRNGVAAKTSSTLAWEDPTGTRKLKWSYAANVGEHDLLKVSSDVNGYPMK